MNKSLFISFEGIDGSGKTTHTRIFCEFLRTINADFIATREPGGTPLGEDIRNFAINACCFKKI